MTPKISSFGLPAAAVARHADALQLRGAISMPTEFRRIVFSNAEFHEAIITYPGEGKTALGTGSVRSARFADENRDRLIVVMHDRPSVEPQERTLPTPFVAAALLRYCIAKRIPIQRSAQKSITVSGDNIALDLRSASKTVEVPTAKT